MILSEEKRYPRNQGRQKQGYRCVALPCEEREPYASGLRRQSERRLRAALFLRLPERAGDPQLRLLLSADTRILNRDVKGVDKSAHVLRGLRRCRHLEDAVSARLVPVRRKDRFSPAADDVRRHALPDELERTAFDRGRERQCGAHMREI